MSSKLNALEKSSYRLMVEGIDDLYSVATLMSRHGIDYDTPRIGMPFINDCKGDSKLLDAISVAVKTYQRVGFVLDADLSISNRWTSVRDRLLAAGVPNVPTELPLDGLVIPGRRPDSLVSVWLMPNNQQSGMLENFLQRLVPSDDRCWLHAVEATAKAGELGAPFAHATKAQLHAWLAWREPPGQPFGTAMTTGCFVTDTPEALNFVAWFRRAFPEAT